MTARSLRILPVALAMAAMLAGCASDSTGLFGGSSLTTSSVDEKAKVDPACVALQAKIDSLRQDGVSDRAAQAAATGKSSTVSVKRASLTQLADLDRANAEFQSKCSTLGPRPMPTTAAAPAPAAPAPVAKAAKVANAKTASAKPAAGAAEQPAQQ